MNNIIEPISDNSACGIYLKADRSAFRGLRNAFNMAQSSFRQMVETPDAVSDDELLESNEHNWAELRKLCIETLTEKSKDIEIFCWLITAQMFSKDPVSGLSDSLQLFAETMEKFWPDLHPMPPVATLKAKDEVGLGKERVQLKLKPLLQLLGESEDTGLLYMPLQMYPLVGDITFGQYCQAERSGNLEQLKADASGGFAHKSSQKLVLDIDACLTSLNKLEQIVTAKCQQVDVKGVSFRFLKESFSKFLAAIKFLLGDRLIPWPLDNLPEASSLATESEPQMPNSATDSQSQPVVGEIARPGITRQGEILNRDHAFAELRRIADFFRKTEPHSPVAFLLERAIRWGYMPLPELLTELMGEQNSNALTQVNQLTGMDNLTQVDLPQVNITQADIQRVSSTSLAEINQQSSIQAQTITPTPTPAKAPIQKNQQQDSQQQVVSLDLPDESPRENDTKQDQDSNQVMTFEM